MLGFGRQPEQGCLAPSVKVWYWVRSRICCSIWSKTLSFFPGLNYPPKSQASNKLVHQFSKFLQPTKDQDFVHHTRHSQEELLVPAPNPGHLTSHPSGLPDAQFVWTPTMTVGFGYRTELLIPLYAWSKFAKSPGKQLCFFHHLDYIFGTHFIEITNTHATHFKSMIVRLASNWFMRGKNGIVSLHLPRT